MRLTKLFLLTILTVFCAAVSPASADDNEPVEVTRETRPAEMIEIPAGMTLRPRDDAGKRVMFRPDQEYKCFTAPEWKTMGNLITDYRWLWYYAIRLETKVMLREMEIGNLELQIVLLNDSVDVTQRGLDAMTGLLDKEHGARTRTTRAARVELWAWRIGTVVGLVAAGAFGGAWGAEKSK